MRAYDAGAFIEAVDEKRDTQVAVSGTVCASCGVNPPYEGFAMCAACRISLGLPVSPGAYREAAAKAEQEAARKRAAHERFRKRMRPKEVVAVSDTREGGHACTDCGTSLEGTHANRKRCEPCARKVHQERKNKRKTEMRREQSADLPTGTICPECGRAFADEHRMRIHFGMSHKKTVVPKPEAETVRLTDAQTGEVLGEYPVEEPVCDLPCAVDPCDHVECTRDDEEPDTAVSAQEAAGGPIGASDDPEGQEAASSAAEGLSVDLAARLAGHEPGARKRTAKVEVEVKGLPAMKLMVRDYEETIAILAERAIALERRRLLGKKRPYELTVESVRDWAEAELDRRKRQRFHERLLAAVMGIEAAVFGADEGEDAA